MKFHEKLKKLRVAKKERQQELADHLNLSFH